MTLAQLTLRLYISSSIFETFNLVEQEFVILMKKRTADSDGSDDIEAAFKVFDTKNDGYNTHKNIFNKTNTCCCFSFIDIEELMSVMVMLGNPRTEDEVRIS